MTFTYNICISSALSHRSKTEKHHRNRSKNRPYELAFVLFVPDSNDVHLR